MKRHFAALDDRPRIPRQGGFSLIELLVASALILIITVGILPLFMRAIASNQVGADTTQLSTFMHSGLEQLNQTSANSSQINSWLDSTTTSGGGGGGGEGGGVTAPTPTAEEDDQTFVKTSPKSYWDTGPRDPYQGGEVAIGDESWGSDGSQAGAAGSPLILWVREYEVRNYGYSDVHTGTISVSADGSSSTLYQVGHPKLYDNPLPFENGAAEIQEFRILIDSVKEGHPLGAGRSIEVPHYRAF